MRRIVLVLILFASGTARAQEAPAAQNPPPVDSPKETDKLKESCFNLKGIPDCAEELFTGVPIHIAVGSIAPQDGFGAGLAYVGHKTTQTWRISWDADAVGSNNASWRAGFYMKFVHTPNKGVGVEFGTPPPPKKNQTELPEHTVFGLYAQTISLNKLTYFGLGPATTEAGRSYFGMTETIVGGDAVKTIYQRLNMGIFGEVNGRFVDIRPSLGQASPSIGQLYTEATAPGLTNQPSVLQLGEGIRMRPIWWNDVVRLNYSLAYQQYLAPGDSTFTFQRLTVDLGNEFALYGKTTRLLGPITGNGPDSCVLNPADKKSKCPSPYVRNAEGTIGVRFFTSLSMTPGGDIVPFYYQPTLGGADINGNSTLSSYQDYRFRAPNVMFVRESFEHSIFRLPLGIALQADEGKVALTRGELSSSPWIHSFSAGLTLRAGGFPQVYLFYSWGGNEGPHTIANMNSSLLGGSTRPSLF